MNRTLLKDDNIKIKLAIKAEELSDKLENEELKKQAGPEIEILKMLISLAQTSVLNYRNITSINVMDILDAIDKFDNKEYNEVEILLNKIYKNFLERGLIYDETFNKSKVA